MEHNGIGGLSDRRSPNKNGTLLEPCENCGKRRYNKCKCQKPFPESERALKRANKKYNK